MKSVAAIVNEAGGFDQFLEKARTLLAKERRDQELRDLAEAGVPVKFMGKYRRQVGPLVIWQAAGRWSNPATGRSGRLNKISMRELVEREVSA